MPAPANTGTLSYNGIPFSSLYKSNVRGTPVIDSAARTVTGFRWQLYVEGYITPQGFGTTDAVMGDIRNSLTRPGQVLRYENKGFGKLTVNADGVFDSTYGPWPRVLDWTPVGNDQSCLVKWSCETTIPQGPGVKYQNAVSEYCYDITWDTDEDGYLVRTVNGHVTVPGHRAGANQISDNGDRLLEQVVPAPMLAFKRTVRRSLSEDKRTLHYSVNDVEQPQQAIPPFMTKADIQHRVSWRFGKETAGMMTVSISGSLVNPNRRPRTEMLATFFLIVNKYLGISRQSLKNLGAQGQVFPVAVDLGNDVFGRSTNFNFVCHILVTNPLANLVKASGLFVPLGFTWNDWQKSQNLYALSPRGAAGLKFANPEDLIVDLGA